MPTMPIPDNNCFLCDNCDCRIKRIWNSWWHGIRCDRGDKGGYRQCELLKRTMKEGLTL